MNMYSCYDLIIFLMNDEFYSRRKQLQNNKVLEKYCGVYKKLTSYVST